MRSLTLTAALCSLPLVAHAQQYHYIINQPSSSMSYNLSVSAPFQTTPAGSTFIIGSAAGPDGIPGNADDTASPPASRTTPGLTGGNLALNTIVNLNSGSLSATGNSGSTVIRPSGDFNASFHPGAGTCSISGFTSSLLGGGTAAIATNAVINFPTFRTREPSCTIFGVGNVTVPVGTITATSIVATQSTASNAGTLTPVAGQPGHYTFSVPLDADVVITANLSGTDVPIDPQPVTLDLTGTVDLTSPTVALTAQAVVNQSQTQPGPTTLAPQSFSLSPLCSAPLLMTITLASTTVNIGTTASIAAGGTLAACGPADIGRTGGLTGSDGQLDNNDFIAFINYFFASNPLADRGIAGGLPGHDGQFDNNDFIVFINQFFAGC
jgi:hypothetical protein